MKQEDKERSPRQKKSMERLKVQRGGKCPFYPQKNGK